ncbi:DHS-like NAD/FAD-binding domain-containing protein [Violaceomyces palustris]|uniref:DHS-like NAD/FAD-binding domain-containing protein n=1 Tax=Violaceomyces palustris TaxID=1673888 RepID=A0ACD0NPL2_9BASI|nr:DHS-like NAD/FAD-binding domain-containing protein [Violaceomyces palustris]
MRISIPSIPESATRPWIDYNLNQATELVTRFLTNSNGSALILTGAGVSVDSGIAPYRGDKGHYTVHKTYRPIFYHEFVEDSERGLLSRRRYYSRSYLGFPPVRVAQPNKTHYSIAAIQRLGYVPELITQNVDNLHHSATPSPSLAASTILELHGTLKHVVCVSSPAGYNSNNRNVEPLHPDLYHALSAGPGAATPRPNNTPTGSAYPKGCGFRGSRAVFQDELTRLNPSWEALANQMTETGKPPKLNPDGDVDLQGGVDYSTFRFPPCPKCGGILKPSVVFFGESVPDALRDHSYQMVRDSSSLLLVGTSLATYSAYRLVKQAVEQGKPTLLINKGPTRADPIVQDKIELGSSEVLSRVAKELAKGREEKDTVLRRLLESGVSLMPNSLQGVISS